MSEEARAARQTPGQEQVARWLLQVMKPQGTDASPTAGGASEDLSSEEHAHLYRQVPDFIQHLLRHGSTVPAQYGALLYHLIACGECHASYLELYDALLAAERHPITEGVDTPPSGTNRNKPPREGGFLRRTGNERACQMDYSLEITPSLSALLAANAPIAFGVSGGKDSSAMVLATNTYLDQIGHSGPRILIHSDLGRLEWKESRPMCERLAQRVGLDLVVVRRQAGDLMERWLTRWRNNCERYSNLECVKLILPWSTAAMPFCRSELKTAIICRDLVERFPGQTILSGVGLRWDESATRAKAPVCMPQAKLLNTTFETSGFNWHPILSWKREDVFAYHQIRGFPLHEAYLTYGVSRVSCVCCILEKYADLVAALLCPANHDLYRDELVPLEIVSTFSFQSDQWLGDVAPHLLSEATRAALLHAKRRARLREEAEARIPDSLLYQKGWPTVLPTYAEAKLLGEVRRAVADAVGLTINYTEPDAIRDRFAELIALAAQKAAQRAKRGT